MRILIRIHLVGLQVHPGHEMTLCIRANRNKTPQKEFSKILLDSTFGNVDPMSSPHYQFFKMSSQAAQIAAIKVRVNLNVFMFIFALNSSLSLVKQLQGMQTDLSLSCF